MYSIIDINFIPFCFMYEDTKVDAHINSEEKDTNWSDWEESELEITCLLCSEKNGDFTKLKQHMQVEHEFDFDKVTKGLSFYDRVKIVNYIRRKIYKMECISCDDYFRNRADLQEHIKESKHFCLNDRAHWDFPQYLFPTYEDDVFLFHLPDESVDNLDENLVFCEDQMADLNLDAATLRELYLVEKHDK